MGKREASRISLVSVSGFPTPIPLSLFSPPILLNGDPRRRNRAKSYWVPPRSFEESSAPTPSLGAFRSTGPACLQNAEEAFGET